MNAKRKGWRNEDKARKKLESEGYYVTRSGGSLGVFDLVAVRRGKYAKCPMGRLVQVKTNRPPSKKEMGQLRDFPVAHPLISKELWIYRDRVKEPEIVRL